MARPGTVNMREVFAKAMQAQGLISFGGSRVASSNNIVNSAFQSRAFGGTVEEYNEVFGTAEEFLQRYKEFDETYRSAMRQNLAKTKGNDVVAHVMEKRARFNLNLFDLKTANDLTDNFKNYVLRLGRLVQKAGLPGSESPSANLYRTANSYIVDNNQGIRHPAQLLLNSMILNYNPDRVGLDSLNISRSGVLSYQTLSNLWDRVGEPMGATGTTPKVMQPFSGITAGKRILMLDSETTGAFEGSQTRSITVREVKMGADGKIAYQVDDASAQAYDALFHNRQMTGYTVNNLNGVTKSVNDYILDVEQAVRPGASAISMSGEGKEFLDEMSRLFGMLADEDTVLVGQNINFDIEKMVDTVVNQSGFLDHEDVQRQLGRFLDRRNEAGATVDMMETVRTYLKNQSQEFLIGQNQTIDDAARVSDQIVNNLFAQETLAKVHMGGSAAPSSMSNVALNTNLFELIEKDGQAEALYAKIIKGSHISETDVHLQSFVLKYIQNQELKLKTLLAPNAESEFGKFARRRIARSAAITPTTDLGVEHLHQTAVRYLQQNQSGVRVSISDDFSRNLARDVLSSAGIDADTASGYIGLDAGEYRFFGQGAPVTLDNRSNMVKNLFSDILENARAAPSQTVTTTMTDAMGSTVTRTATINPFADMILHTGINIQEGSVINELLSPRRAGLSIGTSRDFSDVSNAMTHLYQRLGTSLSKEDKINTLLGRDVSGLSFARGVGEFDDEAAAELASVYAKIGDPLAQAIDSRSRVFSSILANATSGIGQEAATRAAMNNISDGLAHAKHANLTTALGVSFFRAQDATRVFDIAREDLQAISKPMFQSDVFRAAIRAAELSEDAAGESRNLIVGFSKTKPIDEFTPLSINAVVDINETFADNESRKLAETIFDLFSEESKIADALEVSSSQLTEDIRRQVAAVQGIRASGQEAIDVAIGGLHERMKERGVIFAKITGQNAQRADKELAAVGEALENDVLSNMRATVLTDQLGPDVVTLGPTYNRGARKAGLGHLIDEAARAVDIGGGRKQSNILRKYGEIAQVIENEDQGTEKLRRSLNKAKNGLSDNKMLDMYISNKSAIGRTAIGLAAAGLAYYVYKRNKENNRFDEVMEQQPVQNSPRVDEYNSMSREVYSNQNFSRDPLRTAGVVGNLDRRKIGHTNMSNRKYDHLYGG